jgi:hypothetical protein
LRVSCFVVAVVASVRAPAQHDGPSCTQFPVNRITTIPVRIRSVEWIKRHAPTLLPIVIAIAVPLAGVLLALQEGITGDRTQGIRVGAACVLGVCLWAVVLTA